MYTQCPECRVAFKVTASDLKQAAGQVRCGGCSHTFNALEFLSEDKPSAGGSSAVAQRDSRQETENAISAQDSMALEETLEVLGGADVRIEDTGEEWRVLDDDEETQASHAALDDLRYDDNTPLPEDFDTGDAASQQAEPDSQPPETQEGDERGEDEAAVEISLGEPEEWQDILGEFQDLASELRMPGDAPTTSVETGEASPDDFVDTIIDLEAIADIPGRDKDSAFDALYANDPEEENIGADSGDSIQLELVDETSDTPVEEVLLDVDDAFDDDPVDEQGQDIAIDEASAEPEVGARTDKEQTAELEIDQELMALAVADENGLRSTMAIDTGEDAPGPGTGDEPETAADVESIIMEGETVRTAIDREKLLADMTEAAALNEQAKAAEQANQHGGPRWGMIATALLLFLALAAQAVHQWRETLATYPAFNDTIGQVYRALGQPVQPAWDVTGWRFEATSGSTDDEDEDLTVYSRLGNKASAPLPYPIISIALTDRFEETIGSRVLDPAEYLPENVDPRQRVAPGDTVDAVITVKSASRDATGYKLNVCYRLTDGKLRCAVEDFK